MREDDSLPMPENLAEAAEAEGRQAWLATLPGSIRYLESHWSIDVGQPFRPGGQTAWVAPATRHGDDLVLKVLWRHPEAEREADALQVWAGVAASGLPPPAPWDAGGPPL